MNYDVQFVGLKDPQAVASLRNTSRLIAMQGRPPASINGLRYRIEEDVPNLIRVLKAYAYYDAEVSYSIAREGDVFHVYLCIRSGVQYPVTSYQIFHGDDCTQPLSILPCAPLCPASLGIEMGDPALSMSLLNGEVCLLRQLSNCGYPLAVIDKRKVEVDLEEKWVQAAVCVEEGPLAHFGPVTMFGLETVEPRYIARKLSWKEGDVFDDNEVLETQRRLLKSNLFSSVLVTHAGELDTQGELPMKMRLTEAKHRSIHVGAYYATVDGPGVQIGWSHRNLRGMGEILSIDGEFSQRYIGGSISYQKPDFLRFEQTYRAEVNASQEDIHAFHASTYDLGNYIDRIVDEHLKISGGIQVERIQVTKSAVNGTYVLLGLPIMARQSTTDNLLDPSRGYTLVYQAIPFQTFQKGYSRFVKQRVTATFYFPIAHSKWVILALRGQVGSIAGAEQHKVPLPLLFLGGSEDDLRGYKYLTVSPLNGNNKPFGGRSAIFASTELRFRLTRTIGLVPFADFGTVSFNELPEPSAKWFKSVGVGVRYFAFFGPLRLDIGFPLDRRPDVDPKYRLYATIGQSF